MAEVIIACFKLFAEPCAEFLASLQHDGSTIHTPRVRPHIIRAPGICRELRSLPAGSWRTDDRCVLIHRDPAWIRRTCTLHPERFATAATQLERRLLAGHALSGALCAAFFSSLCPSGNRYWSVAHVRGCSVDDDR